MAAKNKHLDHIEDLILLEGNSGAKKAIEVLKEVGAVLSPGGGASVQITTKWDGAPAVIAGIDPSDGRFFVGTKGVFAQQPKLARHNPTFNDYTLELWLKNYLPASPISLTL